MNERVRVRQKRPPGLYHRMVASGIMACGAKEREGAKCSMRKKDITCPKCIAGRRAFELKGRAEYVATLARLEKVG